MCTLYLPAASAVAVLEEIAQRIYNRKKKFEASRPHRRALAIGGGLFAIILLVAAIFGNNPVMIFLGTYSLGWVVMIGVGILGVCLMWVWLIPLFNIYHVNGMETHVEEIRTMISYHRTPSDTTNTSDTGYHLMY